MRNWSSRVFLLTLALVLGQWINVAHASNHWAISADDVECSFCDHAQDIGAGMLQLPEADAPDFSHERPQALLVYAFATSPPSFYAIRGPPASLAT